MVFYISLREHFFLKKCDDAGCLKTVTAQTMLVRISDECMVQVMFLKVFLKWRRKQEGTAFLNQCALWEKSNFSVRSPILNFLRWMRIPNYVLSEHTSAKALLIMSRTI